MTSRADGTSHSHIEMHGSAETVGYGTSRGTSIAEGLSEVFVPVLEWLPSARYSLEEQMHRAQGIIMNLPSRTCLVKVAGEAPFLARTADLAPTFRSQHFKRTMLPRFLSVASVRSAYLTPVADVDAQLAARIASLPSPQPLQPDLTPQPLPIVDDPIRFGREFWKRRRPTSPPKSKPKKSPRGRRPVGDQLDARHGRFEVIDGDGGDNDPKTTR